MLYGSLLGGMAFANAPVGAVHALAYPVGANFKVAHGLSNSLMLPHVLKFNGVDPTADRLYGEMLGDAFPEIAAEVAAGGGGGRSNTELFASGFEALAADLGIETRLSQVGISESDVELLASQAMQQTRLLPNNPREMFEKDAIKLYAQAM